MKTYKSKINKIKLIKEPSSIDKVKIQSSKESYKYIKQFYNGDIEIYESFFLILLNRANNTIGWVKISQGGTSGTVVDVKIITKYAIESLAESVIIAHNHPSGNINPSSNDDKITKKIKKALDMFDIRLLDHIILTENSYYSFLDEGILN